MHGRSWILVLLTAALVAFVGCTKNDDPEELADSDIQGRDTNPDGVSYPLDRQGGRERNAGRPGDRMPNFSFRGYPGGDLTKGLQTISLADYYDPEQKRHKVLHIQVAATWCALCSTVISATVENKLRLSERGIAFVEVIVGGASAGFGPSLAEVDGWLSQHRSNVDTAIDVRARRMRTIGIDPLIMPHDILLDTRTMEILDSSPGVPIDIGAYGGDGVAWVASHPPSY